MKRKTALLLAIVMILTMALSGCGSKDSGSSDGGSAATDDKVYTFRIDNPNQEASLLGQIMNEWAADLNEKSNGRLKIEMYHGATLGSIADCVTNCQAGISDGFWSAPSLYAGSFEATEVVRLPFLGMRNSEVGTAILMDLYNEGLLEKDYAGFHVVGLHSTTRLPISFTAPQIPTSVSQFKGLKTRVTGGTASEFVAEIGAAPMAISTNDGYEAFEKNIIEAGLYDWDVIQRLKLLEQVNSIMETNILANTLMLLLNEQKYNELPDDLKKLIDDSTEPFLEKVGAGYKDQYAEMTAEVKAKGIPFDKPTAEINAEFERAAVVVQDKWVKDITAKGYDGQKLLDRTKELVEKYNQVFDYDA